MQPGDNLQSLLSIFKSNDAIAAILINYEDNYTMSGQCEWKSEIPVVVITSTSGNMFLDTTSASTNVYCQVSTSEFTAPSIKQPSPKENGES